MTKNNYNLNKNKQNIERIRFKIDKSLIIGESEFSLLYRVNDKQTAWISKKICFGSVYTNWINVSPSTDAIFKLISSNNSTIEISARDFKEIVENNEVNKQWI